MSKVDLDWITMRLESLADSSAEAMKSEIREFPLLELYNEYHNKLTIISDAILDQIYNLSPEERRELTEGSSYTPNLDSDES